jgi:hypothetical protein
LFSLSATVTATSTVLLPTDGAAAVRTGALFVVGELPPELPPQPDSVIKTLINISVASKNILFIKITSL